MSFRNLYILKFVVLYLFLLNCSQSKALDLVLQSEYYKAESQITFGIEKINAVFKNAGLVDILISQNSPKVKADIINIGLAKDSSLKDFLNSNLILSDKAESYIIAVQKDGVYTNITVIGSDITGAMYGCFDISEQLSMMDEIDLSNIKSKQCSPLLPYRATNPFIHTQALQDRNSWFFDDGFWQSYLNQLALSRHNFLDFHACYDLVTTQFPNIYPYLLKIDKYPDIGLNAETADRNLQQFSKIVKMAKDRGIKVGLMSYGATWNIPGHNTRQPVSDDELADYTALCVKKLIEQVPDLEFLGFRVGESGKRADFYQNSYIKGLKLANRNDVKLYTRSWVVPKRNIELIANSYPGHMYIEIKYNGEQLGMPYQVSGGWMASKASYSYQSYSDIPSPVDVIWQIRANGTHRIFPWGDPEFISRAVKACSLLDSKGYTVEPLTAYYPLKDYYTNTINVDYDFCDYLTERDWFWYELWGRLGYDPNISEDIWINMFKKRFGNSAGEDVYNMFIHSGRIIPTVFSYRGIGPDHRNIAPEMEWGGPLKDWMDFMPLEVGSYMNVKDYVDNILNNRLSGRLTPVDVCHYLTDNSSTSVEYGKKAKEKGISQQGQKEFDYLFTNTKALQALSDYYCNKLKAAIALQLAQKTENKYYYDKLEHYFNGYMKDWDRLSNITEFSYRPFLENLRRKGLYHHWKNEKQLLKQDEKFVKEFISGKDSKTNTSPILDIETAKISDTENAPKVEISNIKTIKTNDIDGKVLISGNITDPDGISIAKLYYKKMPSTSNWQSMVIGMENESFITEVPITYEGIQFRIEAVDTNGNGLVWPDVQKTVPYITIAGWEMPKELRNPEYEVQLPGIKAKAYKPIKTGKSGVGQKVYLDRDIVMQQLPDELKDLPRLIFNYSDVTHEVFEFEVEFDKPTTVYIVAGPAYPAVTLHGFSKYKGGAYKHNNRHMNIYKRDFDAGDGFFSFDYGGYDDCVMVGFKINE